MRATAVERFCRLGLLTASCVTFTMTSTVAQQPRTSPGAVSPSSGGSPAAQTAGTSVPVQVRGAVPRNGNGITSTDTSVVALVNGQPISRDELGRECMTRHGEQVLENMLNKFVIQQACQAQGIQITQRDIDQEIERMASQFKLNVKMYLQLLENDRGVTPEQYASDIVWPMLALRSLARDKISVSEEELKKAYESQYGPKVQVRMIASRDRAKAENLWKQAKAEPASFRRLAKEHSEDPESASVEGLLPPIRKHSGDDQIEQLAFSLKVDQISEIITIADIHLFLQCVRHIAETPPSADSLNMVYQTIRHDLQEQKLRDTAETVFLTLRENSNVQTILGNPQLEAQHPGVAAFINRQAVPMSMVMDEAIKRHGSKVLEGEIHRKLIEQTLAANGLKIEQADIDREIARAADYYGCIHPDGSPNVEEWIRTVCSEDGASYELYVRDAVWPTVAMKKLVAGKVQVSEEDLQKGFESNYGSRAEILAIVQSNQRTAQEVWQMARANPTEAFFGELANQYSVEPTSRSNYGKVPPIRRHSGQPTLENAAFKLKPGEMSGIIEVGGQYVILRGQGQTNPVTQDFNAVRDELYKDILEKKTRKAMSDELERLTASAMIENFIDNKAQVGAKARQASLGALQEQARPQGR